MDAIATIRSGYAALGLGAPRAVLDMFEQRRPGRSAPWQVHDLLSTAVYRCRPVVALDLFGGLPEHWELTGIEASRFEEAGPTLVVTGSFRCRPKGSWEVMSLPFAHIWTILGGRVAKVTSYLDGIEIRRRGKDESDAAEDRARSAMPRASVRRRGR